MQLDKPLLITLRNAVSIFSNQKNTNTSYTSVISFITVLLPFLYVLNSTALIMLPTFIVTLLTLHCWQLIFKPAYRNIAPSAHTLLCAMLFSLLLPLDITQWALVLCVSFGTVFGERVFGGRGFAFLHPVTVGLAFYLYSDAIEIASIGANQFPLWIILCMAVALVLLDLVSWRTLAGIAVGLLATSWIANAPNIQTLSASSGILLSLLLLAGDPGSGGSTNASRWIHGVLCGALLALFISQGAAPMHATVFAILLASLCAPLLDYLVVIAHTTARDHRHG